MKKIVFIVLLLTVGMLTSCGNFKLANPVGIPTLTLGIGDRSLTYDDNSGLWTLEFTLNAYSLPGSPAGIINTYHLAAGGALTAGTRVEGCPPTSDKDCGPFTTNYKLSFGGYPPEGSYVIDEYIVVGQNGKKLTQSLPEPLVIH